MDSTKNKNVIALSINPKYAHAILSNKKTVEFRRNGVPNSIKNILVYSTMPDQKILGYCDVIECVIETPNVLWKKFGHRGFISFDDFSRYYEGYDLGKCYILENPRCFKIPISLKNFRSLSAPPQSFAYVDKTEWMNIKRKKVQKLDRYNKDVGMEE
jgi:predicted transcriptional regulator